MVKKLELVPEQRHELSLRFWEKVNRDGPVHPELGTACFEWTGARSNEGGYGKLYVDGREYRAHRISFWLAWGRWPVPMAMHKCDNRLCVRVEHLVEGTHDQNMRDMVEKSRAARRGNRGEASSSAKITEFAAFEIRRLSSRGWSQRRLAFKFKITQAQIWKILNGKAW